METLPNKGRNDEVAGLLKGLKDLGLGAQMDAHIGHASGLASLDVAESLQLLQLQLAESTKDNRIALHETTNKLIGSNKILATSNDRHSTAMQWLTGALVAVGLLQVVAIFLAH
jgi:hypothetical protein